MAKNHPPVDPRRATAADESTGKEDFEPGKPTRERKDEPATRPPQGMEDIAEIAKQQGTSQRGYTADHRDGAEEPESSDPEHPGGKPYGDPLG